MTAVVAIVSAADSAVAGAGEAACPGETAKKATPRVTARPDFKTVYKKIPMNCAGLL
jgi:hypothetical protein